MSKDFMKEVAFRLVEKADKNILISMIKNILDSEDSYEDNITQYVIAICVGKPQLRIEDVDIEKLNKYAEQHFINKYYTYVEGSVELVEVDPVKCRAIISYKYTNNDDDKKEVHLATTYVYPKDDDILK